MPDVTRLLEAAQQGDHGAAADLMPLVYDELRILAAAKLAAESPGHTLDATALVHEAYLRLVGDQQFDGRGHFFFAAAEAMRRILVNHARDRNRLKRGGGRQRVDLDRLTSNAGQRHVVSAAFLAPLERSTCRPASTLGAESKIGLAKLPLSHQSTTAKLQPRPKFVDRRVNRRVNSIRRGLPAP